MTFWKRLRFYLIGVGLGLLVSLFFFKGRGCDWTPANRVLDKFSESMILVSDSLRCVMSCQKINAAEVFSMFEKGDVVFGESNPQANPKLYMLTGNREDKSEFKILFSLKDSIAEMKEVITSEKCSCEGLNSEDPTVLALPEELIRKMFQGKDIVLGDAGSCKMECLKLSQERLFSVVDSGKVIIEKSHPRARPHPYYFLEWDSLEVKVEHLQQKVRITDILDLRMMQDTCMCK